MASLGNPKAWLPNTKTKDCSQGFCSLYCPQWCYTMFTPPPPPFVFQEDNSGPRFSPLVIAIIGILASAFLLVSYYAIVSKYCGNRRDPSSRTDQNHHVPDEEELEGSTQDPSHHETWYVSNNGLDEALIKSITVCKYKKGGGLVELTDCSVCLGEFQEDESLRLLPKCSHAFHVNCIDAWLKSHSNCPLCRASIGFVNSTPVFLPPPPPPPFLYDDRAWDSSLVLERQEPCPVNPSSEGRNNNAFPLPPPPPPPPPFLYDDSASRSSLVLERPSSLVLERPEPCAVYHSSERQNNNAFPLPPPPPPPLPPFLYDDSASDYSQDLERQEPCSINHSSERQKNNAFLPPPPPPPFLYDDSDTDSSQAAEWHDPQLVNCSLWRRNDNAASTDIGARDGDFATRRGSSDLGNSREGDSIIEIRRSVSMNHSCQAHLSLPDVLFVNKDEEFRFQRTDERRVRGEVGSSKRGVKGMMIKFRNRNRVLIRCVFSRPLAMKRSFSRGGLFIRRGRK